MFFKKKKQEDQDILKQIKDKIAENDNEKKSKTEAKTDDDLLNDLIEANNNNKVQDNPVENNAGSEILQDVNNIVESSIESNENKQASFENDLEGDFLNDMLGEIDNNNAIVENADNDDDEDLADYKDIDDGERATSDKGLMDLLGSDDTNDN